MARPGDKSEPWTRRRGDRPRKAAAADTAVQGPAAGRAAALRSTHAISAASFSIACPETCPLAAGNRRRRSGGPCAGSKRRPQTSERTVRPRPAPVPHGREQRATTRHQAPPRWETDLFLRHAHRAARGPSKPSGQFSRPVSGGERIRGRNRPAERPRGSRRPPAPIPRWCSCRLEVRGKPESSTMEVAAASGRAAKPPGRSRPLGVHAVARANGVGDRGRSVAG